MTFKKIALAALLLGACGGSQTAKTSDPSAAPAPATSETTTAEPKRVCCESFGYGAQMVECCSKFSWSAAEECKVPAGFVGGNKRVVSDDRCPAM